MSYLHFQTSFANTSSLLVTTENGLDELNSRVQTDPIPMNRFRPNVVVRLPEDGSTTGGKYPEVSQSLFLFVIITGIHLFNLSKPGASKIYLTPMQ